MLSKRVSDTSPQSNSERYTKPTTGGYGTDRCIDLDAAPNNVTLEPHAESTNADLVLDVSPDANSWRHCGSTNPMRTSPTSQPTPHSNITQTAQPSPEPISTTLPSFRPTTALTEAPTAMPSKPSMLTNLCRQPTRVDRRLGLMHCCKQRCHQ